MVLNHNNWTFRRLMKVDDNPGVKLFHKVVKSMGNRFKSRESTSEVSIEVDSLNSSIEITPTVDAHGDQQQNANSNGGSVFKENEELSELSTYHSLANVSECIEMVKFEENSEATLLLSFFDDTTENEFEDVKDDQESLISKQDSQYLNCVEVSENSGMDENLENDDCEQNILEQKKDVDCENINLCKVEKESADSSKSSDTPNKLNILEANMETMEMNNIEDDYKHITLEEKNNVAAAEVIEVQVQSSEENFVDVSRRVNNAEEDSMAFDGEANGNFPKINLNDIEGSVTNENDLEVIDDVKDNSKIINEGHKSLVKDMIIFFNETLRKRSSEQTNCRNVLDDIEYPWNLVRQRINQFSKEQNKNNEGCNKNNRERISQTLVRQRIQQILSNTNLNEILSFHSAKVVATQVKSLQITGKNNMHKSVQTETTLGIQPEFDIYYSNTKMFLRNIQLLLDLHKSDESDNETYISHISSDSLESTTHHETENFQKLLRRSVGVEDLYHLENYENHNLDCQSSEDCESKFISSCDDGEEKIYMKFAGYVTDPHSPSGTTPNYYKKIHGSETESTEDCLTPVKTETNMSIYSAAQMNQEISKKFVMNVYENGQMRSLDNCVTLKKPANYKLIHSENELHIRNTEVIDDNKHVNYGKLNKHSFESDNGISKRVDSVNVGGNNCINVEVPTQFCQEYNISPQHSDTEVDEDVIQASGDVEMETIYTSAESEDGEKMSKTDEIYYTLKHEIDVQGIIIRQASKALEICRNSRNFFAGRELIEAERILLVATRKFELLRNEIRKTKYDSFEPRNDHVLGNITIDNIFLPLQLNEADFTRYNYYFILILSYEDTIFSTKVVEGNSMNYANFEDVFTFKDFPSDFIITIDIYCLKIKKLDDKSCLSKKFKTKNKFENLHPKKRFLYKDVQTFTLMETSVIQSSFVLCGSVAVTLDNINNSSNSWTIKNACLNIVTNTMNLNVSISDVRIKYNKKGFLTVGTEVNEHLAWNRRWCVLDGAILKFFNYPTDEDLIKPVLTLNFKNCYSGQIEICDRERCAKSRTMLLKTRLTMNGISESIGNFLSADSRKDLLEWQSKINLIVGALVKWNQLSSDS